MSSRPSSGTSRATPGTANTVRDGADDGLEQLLDRPVLDQQLGQLEEPAGLGRPPLGLGPGRVQIGHHPGHQQHDHRVDGQGHPVLGMADPEAGRREG